MIDSWLKEEENRGKQIHTAWIPALGHISFWQMAHLFSLPEVFSLIFIGKLFQDTVEKSVLFQSFLLLFLPGAQRSWASLFSFLA